MCRYAFSGPYKPKWACFSCRKMFRQHRGEVSLSELKCPECRAPMHAMGLDFKPPRQSDAAQWRKVELLARHGYKYFSCGCGAGPRPKYLREVPEFLRQSEEVKQQASSKWRRQNSAAMLRTRSRDAVRAKAWKQAEKKAKAG